MTFDEVMVRFTGQYKDITNMPNKPIEEGYKIFCVAFCGYVYNFHISSNVLDLDPVAKDSFKVKNLMNTGRMMLHMIRQLQKRHRTKAGNVVIDNYFITVPLLAELQYMGIRVCGTAKHQKGYPEVLKFPKSEGNKLPQQFKA